MAAAGCDAFRLCDTRDNAEGRDRRTEGPAPTLDPTTSAYS
jgi:hypothetical protein